MNYRKTLCLLFLAIFALGMSIEAAAQTVTFSTGEFVSGEWSSAVSGTGSSVATTEAAGGNPAAYRRVSLTVAPSQSAANRQLWSVAVFNPRLQGAVTSVSLSYDVSRVSTSNAGATQVAKGIAVQQNGVIYLSAQGVSTVSPPTWENLSVSNIVPLFPAVNWTNGSQITFGFYNSVSTTQAGFTIDGGYDNFSVTVTYGAVVPPKLYSVDRESSRLREINPDTGATLSFKSITLPGRTVTGALGLASDPVSGKLFALLRLTSFVEENPSVRELVTLDPNTGVATDIGPANNGSGLAFSDITFGSTGTLYGVTGDASPIRETLFTLDKTTGAATFLKNLGAGDDGETIAFNFNDGLIYHASGQNENERNPPLTLVFDTINPADPSAPVTPIPLTGRTIDEATALAYTAGDFFLWADLNFAGPRGRLLKVTKTGDATLLGSLDHVATGLTYFPAIAPQGPPTPAVFDGGLVNNASFAASPAPVAPGSMAAVFGSNLNDGSTVLFSSFGEDGKLLTALGGASAKVNNIPAPLFYSTAGQIGVQIPFELAGQTSATIQVTVGNRTSVARNLFVDSFAPGIFSVNQQGTGTAAVLHDDGVRLVTEQSPARPDEVVIFFGTGLGVLTPPLATGAPSVGNRTSTPATVTVDGVSAVVEFSGAAPGFVGLNQINVRIPASTRTAPNIPVVLTIGGKLSNTVTIPVAP